MNQRTSIREYLPEQIDQNILEELLTKSGRAPSTSNCQPWKIYVLTGQKKLELSSRVLGIASDPALDAMARGEEPANAFMFENEPYRSRRFECGNSLYAILDIERSDRERREVQRLKNFEFFGAPVALFFTASRQLPKHKWSDCGMYIQNVMTTAVEMGLGTCAQGVWLKYEKTVKEVISMPDSEQLICGMCLGYPDPDSIVNQLITSRIPLSDYVKFIE